MNEKLIDIDRATYQNLAELLEKFMSTKNIAALSESELKGNYTFMNKFASVLATEIQLNKSSEFIDNAFKFINCISDSNNLEVLNILKVGILEILYTSGDLVRRSTLEQLNAKNRIFFLDFSQYYF